MEWVQKYRPKSAKDIQGQDKAVGELKAGVQNFQKGDKPMLLFGPPGTGKTCSVYAVANDLNLEVVEVNASDVRNKDGINQIVGGAIGQQSLFSKGKIVLVDEIGGLSGQKDRGGVQAIMKLMDNSSFPVVMTANDPYVQKFSKLRTKCKMIEFGNLSYTSVASKLKEVAQAEGIKADDEALKTLARKVRGDLRAAVNDLQTLTGDSKKLKKKDVEDVDDRRRKDSIFNALMRIFKTTDSEIARTAYDEVETDLDEIFLWTENNIEEEYKKPEDIANAYDALSIADRFYGRIRRWQHYRFYVYIYDLLTAGIALSKQEKYKGFTKFKRSTKPLKIWRSNQKLAIKKGIAVKIAVKTHTSKKVAMQSTLPYLKAGMNNKDFSQIAQDFYELDEGEVDWLRH
ncbi:replication factor C large subunit [Nanoarchaeota archaeon]